MADIIRFKRGTHDRIKDYTPGQGEPIYDKTRKSLRIGNGSDPVSDLPEIKGILENPADTDVLDAGVIGWDKTRNILKFGDGASSWVDLEQIKATPEKFVNVKDFGAKGDGINDDTSPLIKAIEHAIDNNKILFIPIGTYKISDKIMINGSLSIFGQAPEKTILDFNNSGTMKIYADSFINISNIKLLYPSEPVLINGTSHAVLQQVRISFANSDGLVLDNIDNTVLIDVMSDHNSGIGFKFRGHHTTVTMISCFADNNSSHGYYFEDIIYSNIISSGSDNNFTGYYIVSNGAVSPIQLNILGSGAEHNQYSAITAKPTDQPIYVNILSFFSYNNNTNNASEGSFLSVQGSNTAEIYAYNILGNSTTFLITNSNSNANVYFKSPISAATSGNTFNLDKEIILNSPNYKWKITVDDEGNLVTTQI